MVCVPLLACDPTHVIGGWACAGPSSEMLVDEQNVVDKEATRLPTSWSTGFEDGFCGYSALDGYCYARGGGGFAIVTSPVHSGQFAAAFTVDTSDSAPDRSDQARCVATGVLPKAAWYGAWYYIPRSQRTNGNWNLFHFQGRNELEEEFRNLWDLSLVNDDTGDLRLSVVNSLAGIATAPSGMPKIPIGSWFHLEFYLDRASDARGQVTVLLNDQMVLQLINLTTDDTRWTQWYVGNLADALAPADSTVYVDDVTLRSTDKQP